MSNQQREMTQIRRLFGMWMSDIRANSWENYYDINKAGEHLSRQLLNKMYDYQLVDLNDPHGNFPGLDIGDETKDKIAFQVTSRTDSDKIIKALEMVVKKKFNNTFSNGIRFLILNDVKKVDFGPKSVKTPPQVLSTFKMPDDIYYPETLIKKIETIYEKDGDLIKFNEIKSLLEKIILPKYSGIPLEDVAKKIEDLTSLVAKTMEKLSEKEKIDISSKFFHGDLKPPTINVIAERPQLTEEIWKKFAEVNTVWLQGAPATGKTSLAVLVSKRSTVPVLWIECRDVLAEQLIEYILTLLTGHLQITIGQNYQETLSLIFTALNSQTLIVLNDVPDLQGKVRLQSYLAQFLAAAEAKNCLILATSNYAPSSEVAIVYNLTINPFSIPPLTKEDTETILDYFGAEKKILSAVAIFIKNITEGHPLLILSAAQFLRDQKWRLDQGVLGKIFSGKYGAAAERESYQKVLENTADPETRELLYRMRCVIGEISDETIVRISAVSPQINLAAEKISLIEGLWLQRSREAAYQLSPLIKILDGNLSPEIIKEINSQLATQIIEKKQITQIEASTAITYYMAAGKYNDAAIILTRVLSELIKKPEAFFEQGFAMYWFNGPFHESIAPYFKVQIRVLQISICLNQNAPIDFLLSDLEIIVSTEDVGTFGHLLADMIFFQLRLRDNPLKAFHHLLDIQKGEKEMESTIGNSFLSDELFNGIWIIFSNLHTKEEFEEWFVLYKKLEIPASISDPYKNQLYIMAGVSIYRNAVAKNKAEEIDIERLLEMMIQFSKECGLHLISAYALKYLYKYEAEEKQGVATAEEFAVKYKPVLGKDQLYKFLMFEEIGRQYFRSGNIEAANYYLSDISNVSVPPLFTESLDYLINYFQVTYKKDPSSLFSSALAQQALELALGEVECSIDDKAQLFGEAAIGKINEGKYIDALNLYAQGYLLLLDNFTDSKSQQAIVIRYGNALKYINEFLEYGRAPSFGGEKNVIPTPGYFYRSNEKILEDGFYFDERKFMGASILKYTFEDINDEAQAKQWAYKAI